jgi:hypothetical protein
MRKIDVSITIQCQAAIIRSLTNAVRLAASAAASLSAALALFPRDLSRIE